jgi:hypothetical protein
MGALRDLDRLRFPVLCRERRAVTVRWSAEHRASGWRPGRPRLASRLMT